jgi:hypothetical protein
MNSTTHQSDTSWRPDLTKPLVMSLAGVLILQLILAIGLGLGGGRAMTPSVADTPLFDFTPDQVQGIRIEAGDGSEAVALTRRDDGWVLADLADLQAEGFKVDQLLEDLVQLKRPLPIATSEEARKRFKVADSAFERRLVIEGEKGPLASLLIGDSPGFRRVFARLPDDPGVYDLRLAPSDVSARRDDWIDKGLLRMERDDIVRIGTDAWTLAKAEDGSWTLADSDQPLDQESVMALVMRVANLGYRGVFGIEEDAAYNQQEPRLLLDIGLADGSTQTYRVSQSADSQDYVLKDVDRPWYFKLSEFDLGELLDIEASDLLETAETEETAEDIQPTPVSPQPDAPTMPAEATSEMPMPPE